MRSEFRVYLKFWDCPEDPDELTALLGIEPSEIGRKGSSKSSGKGSHQVNWWQLSSGLDKSKDLDQHLQALKEKIDPFQASFERYSQTCAPVLQCVVYSYDGDRPALPFKAPIVTWLAELNAEIDIDLYVL